MNAQWRQIWKRKNSWYNAWKNAEFQIFCLRACYKFGFPNAPHPITDRHRVIGPGVQEVQEGGENVHGTITPTPHMENPSYLPCHPPFPLL